MSHFPFLDKQYIREVLNPYQLRTNNNWKEHLNSQILEKYVEIKKKQKQKIQSILPRYQIFPKNYTQQNTYSFQYDLNRLQRIKNGYNMKYCQRRQKNCKTPQPYQNNKYFFPKSVSQLVLKNQFNSQTPILKIQNKQIALKRYKQKNQQNKSTKSLTQTNLSPSRLTINKYTNKNSKKFIQSDSQLSIQNFNHQSRKQQNERKTWSSKQKNIQKFGTQKNNQNIFKNCQSTLTVQRDKKNIFRQNQDYYTKQKSSIQLSNAHKYGRLEELKNKNQQKILKKTSNQGLNQFQIDRQSYQYRGNTQKNENNSTPIKNEIKIGKKTKQDVISQKLTYIMVQKQKSQQFNQKNLNFYPSRQQPNPKNSQTRINRLIRQKFDQDSNINGIKKQKQEYQSLIQRKSNLNKKKDNQTQYKSNQVQQKLAQYYGDQFIRIKQQRDYLRKHFIDHLQKRHSEDLPYKKILKIKTNQQANKLIITESQIPLSKQPSKTKLTQIDRRYHKIN